jgi:putative transposase
VDQEGNVLDILVQHRRHKAAANKVFRKLLKGLTYVPRVIVTDRLKSYSAAKHELLPSVEHRQTGISTIVQRTPTDRPVIGNGAYQGLNRLVTRSVSSPRMVPIAQHFRPRRYRLPASEYRQEMAHRFQSWQEITGMPMAA